VVVHVAHRPDERSDCTDSAVGAPELRELARDVEIFGLDAYRHDAR
jgi:hypothetical protein